MSIKDTDETSEVTIEQKNSRMSSIRTAVRSRGISIVMAVMGVFLMTGTAAAQFNNNSTVQGTFCDAPFIGDLTQFAFTFFVPGMVVVGSIAWIATSAAESLPFLPMSAKERLKKSRNSSAGSALRGLIVPPIIIYALEIAGVALPKCLNLPLV